MGNAINLICIPITCCLHLGCQFTSSVHAMVIHLVWWCMEPLNGHTRSSSVYHGFVVMSVLSGMTLYVAFLSSLLDSPNISNESISFLAVLRLMFSAL